MEKPMRLWLSRKALKFKSAESKKSSLQFNPKEMKNSLLEKNLEKNLLLRVSLFPLVVKKALLLLRQSKNQASKV